MNKILFFLSVFFIITSCGLKKSGDIDNVDITSISVDNFYEKPEIYVDEEIEISGLVTHVCRHGGQKLFLAGKEDGNIIRINAGDNISEFPFNLEGSNVKFTGKVVLLSSIAAVQVVNEEKDHHKDDDTCVAEAQSLRHASYYIQAGNYEIHD